MDRFVERCAGLDVHKASVKACIRIPDGHGGRRSETRTFRTTTAGLVLLGTGWPATTSRWWGWSRPGCSGSRSCATRFHVSGRR
jgi:hypothetical protein